MIKKQKSKLKIIAQNQKDEIIQNQEKIYYKFLLLVEQALHIRIIANEMWKYRWDRVAKTGLFNDIISFSYVALENFAVQELWKLFDQKNSVFHVWYIIKYIKNRLLEKWFRERVKEIQKDINLIGEWRHNVIGHRGEVGYFAPDEYQKKFSAARLSEAQLGDFLIDFLSQIKFEINKIPARQTKKELQMGLKFFENRMKREIIKTFENYEKVN